MASPLPGGKPKPGSLGLDSLRRKALIGWACFIFFVCAWMFVFGVLVDRGTPPIEFDIAGIQKKLEAAREDLENKERSRIQGKSGIVKDKTNLDFYEALRDNREDTQLQTSSLSLEKWL